MPKLMVMTGKAPCGEQQPKRCSGSVGIPPGSSKTTLLDRPKGFSMMRIAVSRPHDSHCGPHSSPLYGARHVRRKNAR